ncbi:MAG: acyl-CoA reductase [Dorea sp.]|nr:acyl-CoA reductase [Dorea sp.]
MQTSLSKVTFLTGSVEGILKLNDTPAKKPFSEEIIDFLNDVSRSLMNSKATKSYPDVVTFAFWIRKSSINKLKDRFLKNDDNLRLGKGVAFQIAPSNVPVNFAYSLVSGLLTGNANIVRVPSKDFEQVSIIAGAFNEVLSRYDDLKEYVYLVRYDRDKDVNSLFSSMADTRIVWGGDATIAELRKSPLPPRSGEITFADRYSLAVIDSDNYLAIENKERVAEEFYNDTYLSDQNACTSARIVVWTGSRIEKAKEVFWEEEHKLVEQKYPFQAIQAVNKLTSSYMIGTVFPGCKVINHKDNLITRIQVLNATAELMDYKDNSGFFFEYDCKDILEIKALCDNKRCQTIGYIGDKEMFEPLLMSGIKGVDRIVPVGHTMDFDLIWDGYDLVNMMTRIIHIS